MIKDSNNKYNKNQTSAIVSINEESPFPEYINKCDLDVFIKIKKITIINLIL